MVLNSERSPVQGNKKSMNYYAWTRIKTDNSLGVVRKDPDVIRKKMYRLHKGISGKNWFPDDVEFELAPNNGMKLADAIPNTALIWILSEKLRTILEEKSGADFEFFPVKIRDRKGHLVKKDYFVANLLETNECVDMEKSDFIMNRIIKTQVNYFKTLVLDDKKVNPESKIFRLKEQTKLIIVREDLKNEILNAGCTGIVFRNIDDYGSEFRTQPGTR